MAGYIRQSTFVDGDTITAALFNNEYNQLVNAFSNTSGHKHDGTTAEGPVIGLIGDAGETSPNNKVLIDTTNNHIEFYVEVSSNPVQQIYIADGAIIPVTDSDVDLGTSSLYFKDAYIDTVTTTGNVSVGGNLTVTGNATISGNLTFGDADTDSINLSAEIDSHIIPNTNNTYDLGTATKQWRNIFSAGTLHADAINFNGTAITATAAELNLLDGKAFLDEDDMSSNSATGIASQQSIKAYVDAQVTAQDLDFQGDTGGALSIDLDSESLTIAGGTGLDTVGSGNTVTVNIDSTIATLTGTQTLTNKTLTSPDINTPDIDGGSINGTIIGGATPAAGTFTALSAGSTLTINNTASSTYGTIEISGTSGAYIDLKSPSSDDFDLRIITTGTGGQINAASGGTVSLQVANSTVLSTASTGVAVTGTLSATGTITYGNLSDGTITIANFIDDDTFGTASATTLATSESIKAYVDSQVATVDTLSEVLANGNNTNGSNIIVSAGDNLNLSSTSSLQLGTSNKLAISHDDSNGSIINKTGTLTFTNNADDEDVIIRTDNGSGGNAVYVRADGSEGSVILYHYGNEKLATTSTGIDVTGVITTDGLTTSADINFGDNDKAIFGAGSDLQIYHDGSASYVSDQGTGNLKLLAGSFRLRNAADTENIMQGNQNGTVSLYYDNSIKFATSSTGIDVTGTVTADGLTVDGTATINGTTPLLYLTESDTTDLNSRIRNTAGNLQIHTANDAQNSFTARVNISHSTGDISFYEDTGTTQALYWDASAEALGIGTTSPAESLHTTGNIRFGDSAPAELYTNSSELRLGVDKNNDNATSNITFYTNDDEKVKIDADGNVGIGTASPNRKLHLQDSGTVWLQLTTENTTGGTVGLLFGDTNATTKTRIVNDAADNLQFWTSTEEKMRIANSGNVGIGTSSPESILHIEGSGVDSLRFGNIGPSSNSALRISRDDTSITSGNPLGYLEFGGKDTTSNADTAHAYIAGIASGTHAAGDNPTDLTFGTTPDNSSTISERMRIDSSGNVGIGTDSPSAKTEGTAGQAKLEYSRGSGKLNGYIGANSANNFMTVKATGEVGLSGQSSPEGLLHIGASSNSLGGTTNDSITNLVLHATTSNADKLLFTTRRKSTGTDWQTAAHRIQRKVDSTLMGYMQFGSNSDDLITFGENATERMRIDGGGNVGIGTTSPNRELELAAANPRFRLTDFRNFR
jgi:hypothetical protein